LSVATFNYRQASSADVSHQTLSENHVSRGYLTTPPELHEIAKKAHSGLEPYASAVDEVLGWAKNDWDFKLDTRETCRNSNNPAWIDDTQGAPTLYSRALAYNLTGETHYAQEVQDILERIMTSVESISEKEQQCQLNFSWGSPELVASADLIEAYWYDHTCMGPTTSLADDSTIAQGNCKQVFQNWLAKTVFPIVSYAAAHIQSNWGAAGTNASGYIADYLWDRPDIVLVERNPPERNMGQDTLMTSAEAYHQSIQLMLDRNDGYGVDYHSSQTCDTLDGDSQNPEWMPVKSQITERGIVTEDARREEYCNIPVYNGDYENYPQVYLSNNIQQCELMLRRGDRSCYDNVAMDDRPNFIFLDPDGVFRATHLYPGRGSIERAINAVIIDAHTEWRHDSALEVAYRYYSQYGRLGYTSECFAQIDRPSGCSQGI
jgi:hypothetical protein